MCIVVVWYLLLQSRCLLCTVHKYLRLQLCCPLHRTTAAFTTEIIPLQCTYSVHGCSSYVFQVTVASYRMLDLAQCSHTVYKRYAVVIRRTCPWSLSSLWLVIRKLLWMPVFVDTSVYEHILDNQIATSKCLVNGTWMRNCPYTGVLYDLFVHVVVTLHVMKVYVPFI